MGFSIINRGAPAILQVIFPAVSSPCLLQQWTEPVHEVVVGAAFMFIKDEKKILVMLLIFLWGFCCISKLTLIGIAISVHYNQFQYNLFSFGSAFTKTILISSCFFFCCYSVSLFIASFFHTHTHTRNHSHRRSVVLSLVNSVMVNRRVGLLLEMKVWTCERSLCVGGALQ